MPLNDAVIARLKGQVARGQVVLFTGAGFSRGAKDRSGRPIASVRELREELFALLYPGKVLDEDASLGDLYAVALKRDAKRLSAILESRLGVDPGSLPDYYRTYFSFPWLRVYTLNIDDLEGAVGRQFALPVPLRTMTAVDLSRQLESRIGSAPAVEVVHLNGALSDPPALLTFSEVQYGDRLASADPWYARPVDPATLQTSDAQALPPRADARLADADAGPIRAGWQRVGKRRALSSTLPPTPPLLSWGPWAASP